MAISDHRCRAVRKRVSRLCTSFFQSRAPPQEMYHLQYITSLGPRALLLYIVSDDSRV